MVYEGEIDLKIIKPLLCLLVLACLIFPVSASWSNTLNNGDLALSVITTAGNSYGYTYFTGYQDTVCVYATNSIEWVTPNASDSSNYFGFTSKMGTTRYTTALFDATGTKFSSYLVVNSVTLDSDLHRTEIQRVGTTLNTYIDGTLNNTYTVSGNLTYAYGFGNLIDYGYYVGTNYYDDLSFGDSFSTTALVSVMPHSWYIKRDMIDPSNFAMIDSNGNQVYNNQFHVLWSLGAYADGWQATQNPPDTRYKITIAAPSGTKA